MTPLAFDIRSTTVIVSGYPAVHAMAVCHQGSVMAIVSDLAQVPWLGAARPLFRLAGRCRRCRQWSAPTALTDTRLGYDGRCPACVATLLAECRRACGRLPRAHELYCSPGAHIVRQAARYVEAASDRAGGTHRRDECQDCHLARKKAEYQRRMAAKGA